MRRKFLGIVTLLALFALSTCLGCRAAPPAAEKPAEKAAEKPPAPKPAKKRISIATASTAGAWYPIGGALAATITKYVPGIEANAETGAASIENIRNMVKGTVEMAFLQTDIAYFAYNGLDMFKGAQVPDLRGLLCSYSTTEHVITLKKLNILSLKDAKGKRIGLGAPGSGTEVASRKILELYGITYNDIKPEFLAVPDHVIGLKDGNLDISMSLMPVPTGAFTELAITHPIRLLPLSDEVVAKFCAESPGFFKRVIKAGSYPGQDEDVQTVAYRGIIACTTRITEDEAYQMTKAIWEHRNEWKDAHSVCADMSLETALEGATIPMHKGAVKYYQEKGMRVPDELLPPEMKG